MGWSRYYGIAGEVGGERVPVVSASTSTIVVESPDIGALDVAVEVVTGLPAGFSPDEKVTPVVDEHSSIWDGVELGPAELERFAPARGEAPFRLRMFGVEYESVRAYAPAVRAAPVSAAIEPGFTPEHHIGYIDSDSEGQFVVGPSHVYTYTMVPSAKIVSDWTLEILGSLAPPTILLERPESGLVVLYKDPSVIRIPDELGGGWLMLLGRARFRKTDLDTDPLGLLDGAMPSQSDEAYYGRAKDAESKAAYCVGDIVAYYCPVDTFRQGVQGPWLVVDSLSAVYSDALPPSYGYHYRTFCGAPTGVFHTVGAEWKLFVYYNISRAYPQRDVEDTDSTFDPALTVLDLKEAYEAGRHDERFASGVAVQAVGADVVTAALASPPGPTLEASWLQTVDAWPGTIRRRVRHWILRKEYRDVGWVMELARAVPYIDDQITALAFQPIDDAVASAFQDATGEPAEAVKTRASDPCTIRVDGAPTYFVTITQTDHAEDGTGDLPPEATTEGDTLLGLWRFSFFPRDLWLSTGVAVPGRDLWTGAGQQLAPIYLRPIAPPDGKEALELVSQLDADAVLVPTDVGERVRVYSREDSRALKQEYEAFETRDGFYYYVRSGR